MIIYYERYVVIQPGIAKGPEGEEIHHGHQQHLHHQQQQQQQQYHRTAGRQEEEGAIPAPHEAGVPQRRAEHFANGDTQ